MNRKQILEKLQEVKNGSLKLADFEKQVSTVRGKQFSEETKIDGKQIEKGKMFFRSDNGKIYSLPLQKQTTKGIAFLEPYYRVMNGKSLSTLQGK